MSNVYDLFAAGARNGDVFLQDDAGKVQYRYDQLDAMTARLGNRLLRAGAAPTDRVMVQVQKSPENLLLYLACLRAGLIYLPLNTAYKADELRYFNDNAEPTVIVCDPASVSWFSSLSGLRPLTMDADVAGSLTNALDEESAEFKTHPCATDDTAVIIYTSGTTGKPKGAMITHGNIESNATTLSRCWGWRQDDVMLHALPIYHVHGLFVGAHLPIMNGSAITFLDRFEPNRIISALPESTVYMGVPTNYTRLLASPDLNVGTCRNMRLFTSGSAPLLSTTFNEFQERTGHTIVERYGMSETGMNTSNPLDGARRAGTVGLALPEVACRVVDDAGAQVDSETTGHLQVRGPNVFSGYWRMPGKTAEEFTPDGYFRTGDLASIDADGYVSIVGRNKDLIISGGLNVYPKEIETVVDSIEGITESAVIGVPDPDFGEAVTGIVVRNPGHSITEQEIIDVLRSRIANFKVAKRIHFVDELPRNAMGKVQKNLLRERFGRQGT
jgi:malonyl-CoA/methylmalonyl-CoA synthetase